MKGSGVSDVRRSKGVLSEVSPGPLQSSKMASFATIVNGFSPFIIVEKLSIAKI